MFIERKGERERGVNPIKDITSLCVTETKGMSVEREGEQCHSYKNITSLCVTETRSVFMYISASIIIIIKNEKK